MITKPSDPLVFLDTFGVQKEKDQKKKFHPTEAIARILKEVSDFTENCKVEVTQVAGEQASDRILQSPDGVCSAQTARDIKLTIQTLERLSSTLVVEEISLLLHDSLDLKPLANLVVENLFAEMRQGNEMLVVSQFAHRFSSANKRVSQAPSSRNAASYTTLVGHHNLLRSHLAASRESTTF